MSLHTPAGAVKSQDRLPFVVLRGQGTPAPYYKRRVPAELREAMGASTITVRLPGPMHSASHPSRYSPAFLAAYSRVHQQSEQRLANARAQRRELSAVEQLGVAGAWVKQAGPQAPHELVAQEAAAILACWSLRANVRP